MSSFAILGLVTVGGGIGGALRYVTTLLAGRWWGLEFPYGTLLVNIAGSLLMGVLAGALARYTPAASPELRAFIGVGILGGFTTFSAFSLDAWVLIEQGKFVAVLTYVLASVLLSIGALVLGLWLLRVTP